ncbi:MAG TPA: hypothetical protein VG714_07475 [Acidobacteriaceae bacterium]|nr:hypothetical protein [Acidobacteriaceae bacterium]
MKPMRIAIPGIALAGVLSFAGISPLSVLAQDTVVIHEHDADSANWHAPRGYAEAYPENGTPNMVARQGYAAGFSQGEADASRGKKFKPTDNDAYGKAVIPKGMDKDSFKQDFREAFVKGYTNGYKGESH